MFRTIVDLGRIILAFLKDTAVLLVNSDFLNLSFNDIAKSFGVPPVPSDIPLIGVLSDSSILALTFSSIMLQILVITLLKRVLDIFT